jgi:excisionase family DNA binding protein
VTQPGVGSNPPAELLTAHQLAQRWQVSEKTLRRWMASERLPCIRVGRLVRFDPGDVSRWLSARKE